MTKDEKKDFLKSKGWTSKMNGIWWFKDYIDKGIRLDDAVNKELFSEVTQPAGEVVEEQVSIPMPESVKETLERAKEEFTPSSAYPHVSAGYAQDMIRAMDTAKEEMVKNYQPKTYEDLTATEERLHAW